MSRAYEIRVSESETRTVHVEDGCESKLELLPILPTERMGDLLGHELVKLGFKRDGDKCTRKDKDGVEITVDLNTASVSVKLSKDAEVTETAEVIGRGYDDAPGDDKTDLKKRAKKQAADKVSAKTESLRQAITKKLEKKVEDLKNELDGAVSETTVAALTERANTLGSIQEINQDEAGNVTIRVTLA